MTVILRKVGTQSSLSKWSNEQKMYIQNLCAKY